MELKAIIRREPERIKGFKNLLKAALLHGGYNETDKDEFFGEMGVNDVQKIKSYLNENRIINNYYFTNEDVIGFNENSQPLTNSNGKNLYIEASNLINPSEVYSYLTKNGFNLKHTKLRSEKC